MRYMKKTLIFFILILLISGQVLALEPIKEDLPEYIYELKATKNIYRPVFIIDDTAPQRSNSCKFHYEQKYYNDLNITLTEEDLMFKKPVYTGIVDLRDGIPVYITSLRTFKTKQVAQKIGTQYVKKELPLLGTPVKFRISKDVFKDDKLFIAKGTDVYGIVGNVVVQEGGGSPGEITIERLRTRDTKGNIVYLAGNVYNAGKTTSLITYTIGLVLSPLTFGLSELIVYTVGGSSGQIKQGKTYTVYYK